MIDQEVNVNQGEIVFDNSNQEKIVVLFRKEHVPDH